MYNESDSVVYKLASLPFSSDGISASYSSKSEELDAAWSSIPDFASITRPSPYQPNTAERDQFLPLTNPEAFQTTLANVDTASTSALYTATLNSAHALKVLQEEYAAITTLVIRTVGDDTLLHHHDEHHPSFPPRAAAATLRKLNPQRFEEPERFEDQKEAILYGYKYDPKAEKVGCQDPWMQGGYLPSKRQYEAMMAEHGTNLGNVDGWPTVRDRRGRETAPRLRGKPLEKKATDPTKRSPDKDPALTGPRATRGKKRRYDEGDTDATQTALETDTDGGAFATVESTPGKMTTRFRGLKVPDTRSASVTPMPQSMTASPVPKKPRGRNAMMAGVSDMGFAAFGGPLQVTKKVPEKNPNRSRGMKNLWARRKEMGWVRKPKGSAKVDTKALAAAEKKAEAVRRESEVGIDEVVLPILQELRQRDGG